MINIIRCKNCGIVLIEGIMNNVEGIIDITHKECDGINKICLTYDNDNETMSYMDYDTIFTGDIDD